MNDAQCEWKRQEWIDLVKGPLFQEVVVIALERDIYEDYQELLESSFDEVQRATVFHDWIRGMYVTSVMATIRRARQASPRYREEHGLPFKRVASRPIR
jgi:hypothetical protein